MTAKNTQSTDEMIMTAIIELYDHFNYKFFKNALQRPTLILVEGEQRLGYWKHSTRELAISRSTLRNFSNWYKVKIVLKHEMAHQYVDEVLQVKEADPHGELFKTIAAENEFESLMEVEEDQSQSKDSVIDKIQKLLALANSSNEHEANNAVNFANKLMKKWNISSLDNEDRKFAFRQLGLPTKKRNAFIIGISQILRDHFFVDVIWCEISNPLVNKSGYVLEIVGTPENLEIASYVYEFITNVSDKMFKAHKKNDGYGTRINFMCGVVHGFKNKLQRESSVAPSTNPNEVGDDAPSKCQDIVWKGDPKLTEYYKKRYPNVRYSTGGYGGQGAGYGSGYQQGQSLSLRRGVSSSQSNGHLIGR